MALSGNFMGDQLDIMCEGFFDNIDDLLDFSVDDQTLEMPDSANSLIDIPLPTQFPALDSKECQVGAISQETKISNDIGEDWISDFLYDSNLEEEIKKSESIFQSFSPTSVLEPSNRTTDNTISSSSSSSVSLSHATTSPPPLGPSKPPVPARARSKRPRRPVIPILPPADGPPSIPTILPDFPSIPTILPDFEPSPKRIKIVQRPSLEDLNPNIDGVRKCMHCGIHKTPQWRAGPMGPKTLCNACGVRYKSGRLFPEYRPAASPTFVPSVHSNSHKKVVEIRNKVIERRVAKEYNPAAKNCDLLKYIRV